MRPFTYVRDTIFGILLVALSKNNGQAYNVWNAKGRIPVGKVVDTLFYKTFKKLNLKYITIIWNTITMVCMTKKITRCI